MLELFPTPGLQAHISIEIISGQRNLRCSCFILFQDICELLLEKLSGLVHLAMKGGELLNFV